MNQDVSYRENRGRFLHRILSMSIFVPILAGCTFGLTGDAPVEYTPAPVTFNADLAYLENVARESSNVEVQILALLMQEYESSNRPIEGVAFFSTLLAERDETLTPSQRLVSLSALGILRAGVSDRVPLLGRVEWVEDTIEILEEARDLGNNQVFFSRFACAVVYSQLPNRFGKTEQAREDLEWLIANRDKAPNPGLMRPVYAGLDQLNARDRGLTVNEVIPEVTALTTNFSVSAQSGATFHPPRFEVIVPDQVFAISGLEFTEYYFVVSDDRQHLISIDAGTRPDFARAAYELLKKNVSDLPQLTTVLVTHAHWDHVGGHRFFRDLNPEVRFIGRDNYEAEFANMKAAPQSNEGWFFGQDYDLSATLAYRPDETVSQAKQIDIGGTSFELLPAPGSETPDAMFIHMPDSGLLFVGDFIMPFMGAPFVEEGDLDALFSAMTLIESLDPTRLLHGHQPLNAFFASPPRALAIRPHFEWLVGETEDRIQAGHTRSEIHRENLIPDSIYTDPQSQQFYLVSREQVINRIYDQSVGYWESDLSGLDILSHADYGAFLSNYVDMSESDAVQMIDVMLETGDFHLAERVLRWSLAEWPDSVSLQAQQREAAQRLRIKYQAYNPFKFILYSELADAPVKPVP